ncbi:MAG: SDR family oxidoreductase [Thermodesulfobacteriota bacterium]
MIAAHDGAFIVTGASSGIGKAVAWELGRHGMKLVLNARTADRLEHVGSEMREAGLTVSWVAGNAALAPVADRLVAEAVRLEDFRGFVHCAGVARPGPFLWELSVDEFVEVTEASYGAAYQLVRAAFPVLLKQGGGIVVFVGSGSAELTVRGLCAYSGAKAAEEHLARNLAEEAPEITTIIFRPGVVDTPMQAQARAARGGAGESVRRMFRGIKERGELISAETCARALVAIMTENPRRFHGKIARPEDAGPWEKTSSLK